MAKMAMALLVALATTGVMATQSGVQMTANPMRRVVTMLQMMQKKVEAEGEKQLEMFDKFMCYCKTADETLAKSIEEAETKIPQLESDIKEGSSAKTQLLEDLVAHKADREAAKAALAQGTAIREKEASEFAKESSEDKSNLEAIGKAIPAIEKGMEGSFLQTSAAGVLRRLTTSQDMSNADRDLLVSFLGEGNSQGYAPASGEIVGILKQMKDTMEKDLAEVIAQEDQAKADFDGLVAAKEKEIAAATAAVESKTKRSGELGVEIVNLKEDLDDTQKSLAEDKKFLADLKKNCDARSKEWEQIQKTRAEELIAIADTVKILNDDDALDLAKKTIPSASSFLQVQVSSKELRRQALSALKAGRSVGHSTDMDLIALALHGKKVSFDKVIGMVDDMVVLLGKEQNDDNDKKAYCAAEFDKADDQKKGLERAISDMGKVIEEQAEMGGTLASEIKDLGEGIVALDKSVALATEQRKEEHSDYVTSLAENNAVMGIIDIAKNRLNKFYNPKMYKAPPKRELTEEERITLNMGGTLAPTNPPGGIAGTGITAFVQVHAQTEEDELAAPPPPPPAPSAAKGGKEESGGVIAMMDMMKADVAKETQEMEFEEKDSQAEYEKMVNDAAAKRAADLKSIAEKEAAKAEIEAELIKVKNQKKVEETELMATKEYIANLHSDCDWLLQNFEVRKEARANEIDALNKAKAVLSGADYSLVQTGRHTSLRRGQKS